MVRGLAKTQVEMRQRSQRRYVDTQTALALARAHAVSKNSTALARSVKPKVDNFPPELRVVEKARYRVGFRISNKVFLLYSIGFIALFAAIFMRAEMAASQLRLNSLNSSLQNMNIQHQRLEVQLSTLESPNRIVNYAELHLGMVYPSQVGYLGANSKPPTSQPSSIPLTPQVLSAPSTLFAPAGEAGGGAPTGPPTTATTPLTGSSTSVSPTTVAPGSSASPSPSTKSPAAKVSKSG